MSEASQANESLVNDDSGKSAGVTVILLGIVTTIISLALIWLCNSLGFNLFSLNLMIILPIGAILFGAVAGSGYAIGSWFTGAKVGGGLLVTIVALLMLGFAAAQYMEYKIDVAAGEQSRAEQIDQEVSKLKNLAAQSDQEVDEAVIREGIEKLQTPMPGFFEYFDDTTRNMAYGEIGDDLDEAAPLGVWGYGIRIIEILGFCLGGLIAPLALSAAPYCPECQIYKKTHQVGMLPAGIKPRKVKKKDTEGQAQLQEDLQTAIEGGIQLVNETAEAAAEDFVSGFLDIMTPLKDNKKEIGKMTTRVQVELQYCPDCNKGDLVYKMLSGFGEEQTTEVIKQVEVSPTFSRQIRV